MASDLPLRRKLTVRAHGRTLVLVKRPGEGAEHVLMKALLWALYLPAHPGLAVEVPVGDRYKPDLVALDADGRPAFWAEAGRVSAEKFRRLGRRFPDTHVVVAKWGTRLGPHVAVARKALAGADRRAPVELLSVPPDAGRFVGPDGTLRVGFADVEVVRVA